MDKKDKKQKELARKEMLYTSQVLEEMRFYKKLEKKILNYKNYENMVKLAKQFK